MPEPSSESGKQPRRQRGLALAIALIAGCGCGYAGAQTAHNPSPTTITIAPAGTAPGPGGACSPLQKNFVICVSEDPIDLTKDAARPVTITWKITSADWTFDKNKGIDIKGGEWTWGTKADTEYVAEQKKQKAGDLHKYTINVTNAKTATTLSWDPTIKN